MSAALVGVVMGRLMASLRAPPTGSIACCIAKM